MSLHDDLNAEKEVGPLTLNPRELYLYKRRLIRLSEKAIAKQTRERTITFWLMVIASIVIMIDQSRSEPLQWAQDPKVVYEGAADPLTEAEIDDSIDRVVWSWAERIPERNIKYVGRTLAPVVSAVITYKVLGVLDHFLLTNNLLAKGVEQSWIYLDNGKMARAAISLNAGYLERGVGPCEMVTFSHELGHALGMNFHNPDPESLMFWAPAHCRPVPTDSDIRLAGYKVDTCYAELTKEFDIFIPEIVGKEAYLKYQGNKSGDDIWTLEYVADKAIPRFCSGPRFDRETRDLLLPDIRGRFYNFNAQFESIGEDTWKLRYAQ